MYNWLVFLHILFAFLFMLGHGTHAAAMLAFRNEKDPERALTFFNIVPDIRIVRYLAVLMGVAGLIAAFITPWWRQGWVWVSAVVFLVISFVMYKYGAGYYWLISGAARGLVEARNTGIGIDTALEQYEKVRMSRHPLVVSLVGVLGLAFILWLMRFKPF